MSRAGSRLEVSGDSPAMSLITPFWFKQRQCKYEFVGPGEQMLKVSGPNLVDASSEAESAKLAWEAAFELYRTHVIS
jgi:hypothetical protein